MSDELQDLRRRERETNAKIAKKEQNIHQINQKIKRLKAVKKKIDDLKNSVEAEKKKAKYRNYLSGNKKNWKGAKGDSFEEAITAENGVEKRYKQYYDNVDDLLDSLVDAITKLENQKIKEQGLLSGLRTTLNSILGEIEKIFN